jgi:arginase
LLGRTERLYVHIDLDVLDPAEARANELAVAGVMSVRAVEETLALVRRRFEITGAGMAGYDPAFDLEGHAYRAACGILCSLLGNARPTGH